jgi:DNA-binding NarL/FixJ family response regulator
MLHDQRKVTLVIVDDHPIVIQGLKTLLADEKRIEITGSFTNGSAIIPFLREHQVDVVLLDIMLPDMNGVELCREIKIISPGTCVLALSNHTERSLIMQILQNGAGGYLLKNASIEELISCINKALNGEVAFSKEVEDIIMRPSLNDLKGRPQLTKREKQILQLISEGKTTAIMAEELFISHFTVETHRRNLIQKFEVNNAAELIKIAIQQQLLT